MPNIVDAETEVAKTTMAKHHNEIDLMDKILNIYINGFNLIGSWVRTKENDLEYARLLLVTRSLHSRAHHAHHTQGCRKVLRSFGYHEEA